MVSGLAVLAAVLLDAALEQSLSRLLRAEALDFITGILIAAIGLVAIAVFLLRDTSKDRSLVWFGLLTLLYGSRMLARERTVQLLFDASPGLWNYAVSFINYTIPIPFALFIEGIYGKGWKSSIRATVWLAIAYSVVAITAAILSANPFRFPDPGDVIAPVVAVWAANAWAQRRRLPPDTRVLELGLLVFIVLVLNEHAVDAHLVPWHLRVEVLGFVFFLGCLGYIAARRFFANEHQLILIDQEMEAARRIQSAILPGRLPQVDGLDIAVSYLPMTSVAGDFYDFLIVDEHRLGILVADVAGHGVPAALIASMVKVAITAQAPHADDPGLVLSGLNQVLCSQMSGQFVTAAYVFVDSGARVARYAAAGHPPLLLWRKAAGTIERHSENGLFLGFRASERYGSLSIPLEPGDRILLYTDGLVEAESARGEFFGETRFAELIRAHPDSGAADLVDAILKNLPVWTDGRAQADDLTLLVAGLRA